MNIWRWVIEAEYELNRSGHSALANYMKQLPSDAVDGRHEQLDLYINEAIAMARQLNLGWVELFLRHWHLHSQIGHRARPKAMLKEAIALLEFSAREEQRDCPQGVCAVQDLAMCYGCFDGPGYVEERIAVCEETLARIDPTWPCYSCIATEQGKALVDGKRYQECLDFLDRIDQEMMAQGESKDQHLLLIRALVRALLGDSDSARGIAKAVKIGAAGETFALEKRLNQAKIELLAGEIDVAYQQLPSLKEMIKVPIELDLWGEVMLGYLQARPEQINDEKEQQLLEVVNDMEERGAYRHAFDLLTGLVELSRQPHSQLQRESLLEAMVRIQPSLRRDLGAAEQIARLQQ